MNKNTLPKGTINKFVFHFHQLAEGKKSQDVTKRVFYIVEHIICRQAGSDAEIYSVYVCVYILI